MVVRLVTQGGHRPHNASTVASDVASVANGVVIAADRDALVASVGERPAGIVVDSIPTDNPPKFLRLAVHGDLIEDTGLTSQTIGATVYSDGDGTYSTTEPNAGVGAIRWEIGYITDSDATSTHIQLHFQATEDADA